MVDPNQFEELPLTYLTFANATQRERAQYGGFYEADIIPPQDFRSQGTISLGEAVYPALYTEQEMVARGYKGPVMLVAGERDVLFCADPDENEKGSCRKKLAEMGKRVWPDARKVRVYVARETGHTWMMHYNAKIMMWRIHNWLDGVLRRRTTNDMEAMEGGDAEDRTSGQFVIQDELLYGYDESMLDGE